MAGINSDLINHALSRFYFYSHPSSSATSTNAERLIGKAKGLLQDKGIDAEIELFCKGTRDGRIKRKSLYYGGVVGIIDKNCSEEETGKGFVRVVFSAFEILLSMESDWWVIDALSVYYYEQLPKNLPHGYKGFLIAYVPNVGFSADVFMRVDELLQNSKGQIKCFDFLTTLLAEFHVFVKVRNLNFVDLRCFNDFFNNSLSKVKLEDGLVEPLTARLG